MIKTLLSIIGLSTAAFGAGTADGSSSAYLTDLERNVAAKYPLTFTGSDKFEGFDIGLLKSVFGPENAMQNIRLQQLYLRIITQYAEQLAESNGKKAVLAALNATRSLGVDGFIESGNELLVLRVLAAAREGSLSPEEFALFEHIPGSKVIFALYQEVPDELPSLVKTADGRDVDELFESNPRRFAWQHSNTAINYYLEQPETPGKNKHRYTQSMTIGQKGFALLNSEFGKQFGEKKVYWPMPSTSKIGLSLLVKALLDDIMLLPLPAVSGRAHGIDVTPLGMAFHDYLHGKFDTRRQQLWSWCVREVNKANAITRPTPIEPGAAATAAHAEPGVEVATPYNIMIPGIVKEASARYKDVIRHFGAIYTSALEKLKVTGDLTPDQKQEYNSTIVPIYLIFHEAYVFDKAWLDNPKSSVQLAVASAKKFFEEDLSKAAEYPVEIPDARIIDSIIETETFDKGSSIYKGLAHKIRRDEVLLDECSVRRNPMNTVVTIITTSGVELVYAYPTKDNIERDLKDHVALLKLCGYLEPYKIDTKLDLFSQRDKIKAATMQLFDDFLTANYD